MYYELDLVPTSMRMKREIQDFKNINVKCDLRFFYLADFAFVYRVRQMLLLFKFCFRESQDSWSWKGLRRSSSSNPLLNTSKIKANVSYFVTTKQSQKLLYLLPSYGYYTALNVSVPGISHKIQETFQWTLGISYHCAFWNDFSSCPYPTVFAF